MKVNKMTQCLIALGVVYCAPSAFALEAWNGQEVNNGNIIEVIFDGGVYKNIGPDGSYKWAGKENCPGLKGLDPWNTIWRKQRDATAQEIKDYGNPTTCDVKKEVSPEFSSDKDYKKGDIVSVGDWNYKAAQDIAANSFEPAMGNPWEEYSVPGEWSANTAYQTGMKVIRNGFIYEAKFYSSGQDPAMEENQDRPGHVGFPWIKGSKFVKLTDEQLKQVPEFDSKAVYDKDDLVRYNNKNYKARKKLKNVEPGAQNPWLNSVDWKGTKDKVGMPQKPWPAHVFAPYVDFTRAASDIPDMAAMAKNDNVNHFVAAFIVAKDANSCVPTWGTYYGVNNYSQYSKIKALRALGGDVMVSLGGASNTMLATACKNENELRQQYADIVENLNLNALDFDIEGNAAKEPESYQRRNKAVSELQAAWKKEGREVSVWYTLAVLPTGLTDALAVLEDADKQGVVLAGINVMTMDYGNSACSPSAGATGGVQGECSTRAIDSLYKQVKDFNMFKGLSEEEIYARLGSTPMIGGNDQVQEIFYPNDAKIVLEHAQEKQLGLLSMWSTVRDKPGTGSTDSFNMLTEAEAPAGIYAKTFAPFTQDTPVNAHKVTAIVDAQQLVDGTKTITLDGRKSNSKDGNPLIFKWKQLSGDPVELSSDNKPTTTFTLAQPAKSGHYVFSLTVTNKVTGTKDTAQTLVIVDSNNQQMSPSVALEPSYRVSPGQELTVTAKSSDFYGEDLIYQWDIPDGMTLDGDANSNTVRLIAPTVSQTTSFPIDLQVTNAKRNLSGSAKSQITVEVKETANVPKWDAKHNYAAPKEGRCFKVSYKGQIWTKAQDWSEVGKEPGIDGEWGVWRLKVDNCN